MMSWIVRLTTSTALLIFVIILMTASVSSDVDERSKDIAEQSTREFISAATSKGYIDNRDYQTFQQQLMSTGVVYDTVLEYRQKKYKPLYGDVNDFYTFTDNFEVYYDGYYTMEILNKLFPGNGTAEDDPSRRYNMSVDGTFTVRIKPRDTNLTATIMSVFFKTQDIRIPYSYSGRVRNEAP